MPRQEAGADGAGLIVWRMLAFYSPPLHRKAPLSGTAMSKRLSKALKRAVIALGAEKETGALLWPDMDPEAAGDRLSHAIDDDRRERLKLGQIDLVWLRAHHAGKHDPFYAWALSLGYRVVAVTDARTEVEALARQAIAAAEEAHSLTAEITARMKAAHLNIDA